MRAAKNIFANIDKVSILIFGVLILFGWINIYASQYNEDTAIALDLAADTVSNSFLLALLALLLF